MLIGVLIGQRTPGHSTAEAVAFEQAINQRYVDYIGRAGWDYLGVYDVEGLVPGAFGEILPVAAAAVAEALERDHENEKDGLPADVAAFYAECRALFWQRGAIRFWTSLSDGAAVPARGEAVRMTLLPALEDGALPVFSWTGDGEAPVAAVRMETLQPDLVLPTGDLLPDDVPPLPTDLSRPISLTFRPLVPAPEPSPPTAARP